MDFKYISDNPNPDKQVLKNNIVHECKVQCITIVDNKLCIPYAVNRDTAKKMLNQAIQMHVCFYYLTNRLLNINNSVIKDFSMLCSKRFKVR